MTDTFTPDGRTIRRQRNVDAVLDAVISLAGDGHTDPTSEEIAERAGVSHRSIYRYFDSRAELFEAAMARGVQTIVPRLLFGGVGKGVLSERIDVFVRTRTDAYWEFRRLLRAVQVQHNVTVHGGLRTARAVLRDQLAEHFAPELALMTERDPMVMLAILDAPFQFQTAEYMVEDLGLDAEQLVEALTAHLERWLTTAGTR